MVSKNLTYSSLEPYSPASERLQWLANANDTDHAQPCEQLARYYRSLGYDSQARAVLHAKQRRRRASLHAVAKLWDYLQDVMVGYGYKPARALLWRTVMVVPASGYFSAYPPQASDPGNGPHFQPVAYALDLLVQVLGLGQRSSFVPGGASQWVA